MPAATLHCMLALNNTRQAQLESGGGDGGHGGLLGLASMRLDEQETKRQDESLYQERSQERSSPLSRLPGVAPGSPSSPRRAPFSSVDALLSSLSEFERNCYCLAFRPSAFGVSCPSVVYWPGVLSPQYCLNLSPVLLRLTDCPCSYLLTDFTRA